MTEFRLKDNLFLAHRYDGSSLESLPEWLSSYSTYSVTQGRIKIWRDIASNLHIPNGDEGHRLVSKGQWIVKEQKGFAVYSDKTFSELYEEILEETPLP